MEIGGTWRAVAADEPLRRAFTSEDFDDRDWEPITVPGHWRTTPAFATSDGPLLFRRRFEAETPGGRRRAWLTLDGIFYDGDVWLDGSYVGATEGYFFPHTFEVTDALRTRSEHVLAVEVGCSRPEDPTAKRNLTGVFQHWDCLDPAWNPGGIWRPVHLSETGPVRISSLRVLCGEATPERAMLSVRAVLGAAEATDVLLRVVVSGPSRAEVISRHALAGGDNRIRLQVPVEQPALWWPHALGDQPVHDVRVEVLLANAEAGPDGTGHPLDTQTSARRHRRRDREDDVTPEEIASHVPSDIRTVRTGLRQVRMKDFIVTVNGERLFVKGSNQGPTRMALAEASPAELERDVVLAREAGLDLLRVHAHITRHEFYDAADRYGMLLWQDLPLQWGYAHSVRRQAVRQAQAAVDLLSHHPSIAVWCGHNEPLALAAEPGIRASGRARLAVASRQELPTWNKTVLDGSVGRALERADPTRPVVRHSGIWPNPVSGGTDIHLYLGWYRGEERDLPRLLANVPRLARFVTEFGAQAVPPSAEWMDPERWPDLDWDRLERHHALQLEAFERFVPPEDFDTFDGWRAATQAYQATLIRHHIETIRRLKYRPAGGFCHFCFADGHPGVTWSVLDHDRRPKTGHAALVSACAPVIVVAERPAASYPPGAEITLDVHVVSDLRRPLLGVRVVASIGTWSVGWEGDIPADDCVRVGTIRTVAPPRPGALRIELALAGDGVRARNEYVSEVVEDDVAPGRSRITRSESDGGRIDS